ncbi:hypothetical protein ACYOEI_31740, partial [Singulisphaera rosea]
MQGDFVIACRERDVDADGRSAIGEDDDSGKLAGDLGTRPLTISRKGCGAIGGDHLNCDRGGSLGGV